MNRHAPRPLLAFLLGASVLSLAAFAASAQTTVGVGVDNAAQAQIDPAATDTVALDEAQTRAAQRDADRNCLRHTGTRIAARHRSGEECVAAIGRSHTRDDLDRTGEVDMAEALRKLDPAVNW